MPLQPSVQPPPPAGSSTTSSYLYNQHQHPQLHLNSQPQQHHIYTHPILGNSRSSLSLSYAPGPSSSQGNSAPAPSRPPYPQHRQQSFQHPRDEYPTGVDVAAWVKGSTTIPAPEQGTSRHIPSKPSSRLSVAGGIAGIAGPANTSSAVPLLSKSHIAPPTHHYYHHHQRSDSHSSVEYPYNLAGPTIATPAYDEGWTRQDGPSARGWDDNNGAKGPAYVFPVLNQTSLTEHLSSHHHHQTVPPMMSYGLPAHTSSPLRQSGSAAAAMPEFAGGGTSGTSHSASPLDSSSHNNGSSHDPASSATPTLDVYNSQSYGHHLPPLDEFHHPPPPPPPSRPYPAAPRFPQPYTVSDDSGHYTIPPPHTTVPAMPEHVPVSTRASISSNSSSTMHSTSPPTYPATPSHSESPEQRPSSSFVHTSPTVAHNSVQSSPVVSTNVVSTDVSAVVPAQSSSGSPEAAPRLAEPVEELNLIPEDGTGAAPGNKEKQSIFECPGCDLTFTRLSALKQHMLSHTGEKPHACDHCGRRFSLASNLRRHTTTKACKVLKFQAVKENISGGAAASMPPTTTLLPPLVPTSSATPAPSSSSPPNSVAPQVLSPVVQSAMPPSAMSSPEAPKKDKKRKATSEKPSPRRKRHANFESRWIPRTLALFKNAHLLTSTPPFQFCMYKAKSPSTVAVVNPEDEEEDEPFTRPTMPLNPVRPSMTSRASIRSMDSVGSADSSGSSSSSSDGAEASYDDGSEERDSYEEAPEYPYHPMSWSGKLPGPGMLGGDELVKNPSVARRWMTFKR